MQGCLHMDIFIAQLHHALTPAMPAAAVLPQVAALQAVMALPEEEASAQLIIERCVTQPAGQVPSQHRHMWTQLA
jgi:hypothetical protein